MTREKIKNTPELVDFMLDKCILADSRTKVYKRLEEVCDLAIKAVEQESVIDKIRAEIEVLPKTYPFTNHIDTYVKEDDVKKIIDKYITESEKV